MFDPNSDRQMAKLRESLTLSLGQMKVFVKNHYDAWKQVVGKHYSDKGTTSPVPLPMIAQALAITKRALVSAEPQVLVSSRSSETRAASYSFELALNRSLADMDFGQSLNTWVLEAMTAPLGILKVALDIEEHVDFNGMPAWSGKPFAEPVIIDDWVHDMSARRLDRMGYCGNRYSVPKQEALSGGQYDPEVVARIQSNDRLDDNSTQKLATDRNPWSEDYREMIELWDIWLPDEGLVVTMTKEFQNLPPLRVVEWNGGPEGPYHFLWFDQVPGNTMPLPPVALWRDIHVLANKLFNKLSTQALRQKKQVIVPTSAIKDGKLIVTGADGEALVVDNPDAVKEVAYGGFDQSNFQFVLGLKQLHSYYAGNTDALGGLGPQSGTVGQDRLLSEAASGRVQSMQGDVDKAVEKVLKAVARFLWDAPALDIPIVKKIPGVSEPLHTSWSRDTMPGDFDHYDIALSPYSLRRKAPEEQLNTLQGFMATLLQALPLMQAQGIVPNMEVFIKQMARLTNMPQLNDLVTYTQGQQIPELEVNPKSFGGGVKPARTVQTPAGQETVLMQQMASQAQEAA